MTNSQEKRVSLVMNWEAKPDQVDAMKQTLARILPIILKQEGNEMYHFNQSRENPTQFMLFAIWRDQACFQGHCDSAVVAEFGKFCETALVKPYTYTTWMPLN